MSSYSNNSNSNSNSSIGLAIMYENTGDDGKITIICDIFQNIPGDWELVSVKDGEVSDPCAYLVLGGYVDVAIAEVSFETVTSDCTLEIQ